jgi:hypothetical protein
MAYSTIVSGAKTYVPRAPGIYVEQNLGFDSPKDEFRVSGASRNKDGSISGSTTKITEKDVAVNGVSTRHRLTVVTTYYLSPVFTVSEVQTADKVGYDFAQTAGYLNRLLQGEA